MKSEAEKWVWAEKWVDRTLEPEEQQEIEEVIIGDPDFRQSFQERIHLIREMKDAGDHYQLRKMLKNIHDRQWAQGHTSTHRTIPLKTHYLRTGAVAASVALLTTLSAFWLINHNERQHTSQYHLLKKELENIKRSQSALLKNISGENTPIAPANYSGTGFALTNDGYFITNYHVTENADSVYIQNETGTYFKAHMITFDVTSDIAIMKVDNEEFRFGKTEVPYSFAQSKKGLGVPVFTLGYPQDDVVYNEGYISSRNGYQGDSLQYRLELPASPGQSGAPVLDMQGQIVGLVTGKASETGGTTFAVSSEAIYKILRSAPDILIQLPKYNRLSNVSRHKQIEKLMPYTFAVKVYKK